MFLFLGTYHSAGLLWNSAASSTSPGVGEEDQIRYIWWGRFGIISLGWVPGCISATLKTFAASGCSSSAWSFGCGGHWLSPVNHTSLWAPFSCSGSGQGICVCGPLDGRGTVFGDHRFRGAELTTRAYVFLDRDSKNLIFDLQSKEFGAITMKSIMYSILSVMVPAGNRWHTQNGRIQEELFAKVCGRGNCAVSAVAQGEEPLSLKGQGKDMVTETHREILSVVTALRRAGALAEEHTWLRVACQEGSQWHKDLTLIPFRSLAQALLWPKPMEPESIGALLK